MGFRRGVKGIRGEPWATDWPGNARACSSLCAGTRANDGSSAAGTGCADDANAGSLELLDLVGIVRKQPHGAEAERFQCFRRKFVVARIGRESEPAIRFHGVETVVLQFVSFDFVDQADAAAFLREIEHHAGGFFRDLAQRKFKLRAAVAPLRREDVSRQALRMDAHERGLGAAKSPCTIATASPRLGPALNRENRELARTTWAIAPWPRRAPWRFVCAVSSNRAL